MCQTSCICIISFHHHCSLPVHCNLFSRGGNSCVMLKPHDHTTRRLARIQTQVGLPFFPPFSAASIFFFKLIIRLIDDFEGGSCSTGVNKRLRDLKTQCCCQCLSPDGYIAFCVCVCVYLSVCVSDVYVAFCNLALYM